MAAEEEDRRRTTPGKRSGEKDLNCKQQESTVNYAQCSRLRFYVFFLQISRKNVSRSLTLNHKNKITTTPSCQNNLCVAELRVFFLAVAPINLAWIFYSVYSVYYSLEIHTEIYQI